MRRQISYTEPIPQFDAFGNRTDIPTRFTIIVNNDEEYALNMEIITNPARGITDIVVEDLPDDGPQQHSQQEMNDFISGMMDGVTN